MAVLSPEHLQSLDIGAEFKTPGVLLGLDGKEEFVWRMVELGNNGDCTFALSYFGVAIGSVEVSTKNGALEIAEV